MQLCYSPHAEKRMRQRTITQPMVMAVALNSTWEHKGADRFRAEFNGLVVYLQKAGRRVVVVTTFSRHERTKTWRGKLRLRKFKRQKAKNRRMFKRF